ncbi:MAG: hypothetical protein BWY48_00033 [Parcubacteria group bacterium ADurb.Bin305]|jgi:prepilin-type N-terminal cleavage/methylation domain-containing protein|nr:prepilin-type N-terminal cleavage/methylation domain-containing protein [Candidatus Paceibacterota bacterium]MDD3434326.1 prepilin-type N-terminal cleavage/methylation domain-containing protein [Candidatus Paceibacterota bacterium]OQA44477.1 MAG: hypothetical protein BWY48_00033 [Parcubacteria group bacterium ADurb.Bin305]
MKLGHNKIIVTQKQRVKQLGMFKQNAGFTIIEMLVTITIITLLSTMILGYSRQAENTSLLTRMATRIVFELQGAQHSAMSTLSESGENICGWGVYFGEDVPQTEIIIFKDLCNVVTKEGNYHYNEGEAVEKISFLKGVELSYKNINSICYVPPEPRVVFFPALSGDNNQAVLILKLEGVDIPYYKITVSKSGQVYKNLITD